MNDASFVSSDSFVFLDKEMSPKKLEHSHELGLMKQESFQKVS